MSMKSVLKMQRHLQANNTYVFVSPEVKIYQSSSTMFKITSRIIVNLRAYEMEKKFFWIAF